MSFCNFSGLMALFAADSEPESDSGSGSGSDEGNDSKIPKFLQHLNEKIEEKETEIVKKYKDLEDLKIHTKEIMSKTKNASFLSSFKKIQQRKILILQNQIKSLETQSIQLNNLRINYENKYSAAEMLYNYKAMAKGMKDIKVDMNEFEDAVEDINEANDEHEEIQQLMETTSVNMWSMDDQDMDKMFDELMNENIDDQAITDELIKLLPQPVTSKIDLSKDASKDQSKDQSKYAEESIQKKTPIMIKEDNY